MADSDAEKTVRIGRFLEY
ncbi:hypothetical protein D018_3085A, partial [Vibrio parahaemolyticus VP2007-007]